MRLPGSRGVLLLPRGGDVGSLCGPLLVAAFPLPPQAQFGPVASLGREAVLTGFQL